MQARPELAKNLSNELVDALQNGDEAAIGIAVETAAQQVDVSAIKLLTQRGQYIRKMLDALGEQALRDAAVELESTEPAAFEAVRHESNYATRSGTGSIEPIWFTPVAMLRICLMKH